MFSPGTECDLKSQIPQNHKGWQPPDKPDKPPDIQPDKRLNLVEKKKQILLSFPEQNVSLPKEKITDFQASDTFLFWVD